MVTHAENVTRQWPATQQLEELSIFNPQHYYLQQTTKPKLHHGDNKLKAKNNGISEYSLECLLLKALVAVSATFC